MLPNQNELADMLRYMRPHGSAANAAFNSKFLTPLGVAYDKVGNGYLKIGDAPIIWSSHTDTVHSMGGRQGVILSSTKKNECFASVPTKSVSNCLGADCTTGVFIMMHMIRNKVPGLYIFHYGEESGCIGSRAIKKDCHNELKTYKAAIAFDRKDYTDIVEYQNGRRCCSEDFITSLSSALGDNYYGELYKKSSGVYTDTAEYVGIIGECTNISVGYKRQHTKNETQDIDYALWLAQRMCTANFESLIFKRQPNTYESEYNYQNYYRGGRYQKREPITIYELCRDYPYAISKFIREADIPFESLKRYCQENDIDTWAGY